MKKNILILGCSILLLIVAIVFYMYVNSIQIESNEIGNEVENQVVIEEEVSKTKDLEDVNYTDFSVYTSDNKEVKLSEYKDKAVMLLFFNPNNPESMEVLDKVELLYSDYEDKIKFFMINTAEKVGNSLKNEYTIEIYYDTYNEATQNYNITEVPSMIYINAQNEVFNAKSGFTTTDALEANLDILSENI